MSASFLIEKPSVVAVLPRPIDRSNGRYVVAHVHGGTPGSRKRKRSELAIGVDGEGLNIYDVSTPSATRSSKLVASYAIPPQSSFSCAPSSVRLRIPSTKSIERRTYVSWKEETARITLFRDIVKSDGTTESSTTSKIVEDDNNGPVIFLDTIPDPGSPSEDSILLLRKSGQITCLNGLDLNTRWTSAANVLGRNTATPDIINHKIEFVELTDTHRISKIMLKSRGDLLSVLPQEVRKNGYSPPILVVITTPDHIDFLSDRTLHILALPVIARHSTSSNQSVHPLLSVSLPWSHQKMPDPTSPPTYSFNSTLGVLYELHDSFLTVTDLEDSHPKVRSRLYIESSKSFLVLSTTSVLAASAESLTIYHSAFQSVQASIAVTADIRANSMKRKFDREISDPVSQGCRLVAYSHKQSTAYAIAGNDLLAFQIDCRRDIPGQHRAIGLLLHSLGRGVAKPPKPTCKPLDRIPLASFGSYTPGSDMSEDSKMEEAMAEMDRYVVAQDVEAFERVMARGLGVSRRETELKRWNARRAQLKTRLSEASLNGVHSSMEKPNVADSKPIPSWRWPKNKSDYPEVDPRWADYALSRIFSWSKAGESSRGDEGVNESQNDLIIVFYPHNVVNWLIETGSLTPSAVQSALRQDSQTSMPQKIHHGQLVMTLCEVDPEFETLLTFLSHNFLDAPELLHAIRLLMQSLELLGETSVAEVPMLTNGDGPDLIDSELQAIIEVEQENADRALDLAEHRLEDHSSIRGRALSLALTKLSACPVQAVVSALRSMFSPSEILSLIYLLRLELVRGAWTSKYLDGQYEEDVENGNSIGLVSGLLNCCVDAIGAGGWLTGDAMPVYGDLYESEHLITTLKLEVSAALEGVEEASYLKGLTTEMVRYGEALQKAPTSGASKKRKGEDAQPIILPNLDQEVTMLPLGLKSAKRVSSYWVGAGGEVHRRTAREVGLLKSKQVGKYSRERIDV